MKKLNINDEIYLNYNKRYSSISFDGNYYFCIDGNGTYIIKYNNQFENPEHIKTKRVYKYICYDYKENCFWALSNKYFNKIFKLDYCLNEIDYISYDTNDKIDTSIAYDYNNDSIIVSKKHCLYKISKQTEKSYIIVKNDKNIIKSIFCIFNFIFIISLKDNCNTLYVYDNYNNNLDMFLINDCYDIKDITLNVCFLNGEYQLEMFAVKRNIYNYLIKFNIRDIISDFDVNNLSLLYNNLGFNKTECNNNTDINENINKMCNDGPSNIEINKNACNDIIQSIALVEASLAHILNAEGEKIQKTLKETNDLDKILKINKEVNRTIINTTHLEQILYNKLAQVTYCFESCCDNDNVCCDNNNVPCDNDTVCCDNDNVCCDNDNVCCDNDNVCCDNDNVCCDNDNVCC
ncbi:MAG: hypothetical protein ACRCZK_05080, partial [Oscillospiraceae bacterium]